MSSTKKESREEANEDSEEQDVTEPGRVFQRIEQEGRKEDRWAEVEHKGTSIDLGFRRLYLQREDAEESLSWRYMYIRPVAVNRLRGWGRDDSCAFQ